MLQNLVIGVGLRGHDVKFGDLTIIPPARSTPMSFTG
jgi:hypothetical protein